MRFIDRTLPTRREAIEARAAAVQAASSAVHICEDARGRGQSDLSTLMNCHAELSRQRRAFLTAVRDYNLDIAEYALSAADPSLTNDRIVAMLIRPKGPTPAATEAPGEAGPPRPAADDPLLQPALPANTPAKGAGHHGGWQPGSQPKSDGTPPAADSGSLRPATGPDLRPH